jgi:hypothetical protein
MTPRQTSELIKRVFVLAGRSLPYPLGDMVGPWAAVLADVDYEAALAACGESTWHFPPSAGEVRELALARSGDAPTGEAETIAIVVGLIGRHGLTGWDAAKAQLDPFVLAVTRAAGGWSNLCRSNADYVATAVRLAHRSTREAWATAGSPAMSELTPPPTVRALAPAGDDESDRDRHLAASTAHRPSALAARIAARAALAPVTLPADTVRGPYRPLAPADGLTADMKAWQPLQAPQSAAISDRVRALAENIAANPARNGGPIPTEPGLPRHVLDNPAITAILKHTNEGTRS